MTAGVLIAMLFVIALFAGAKVLPIMLLILIIATAAWGVAEWRTRRQARVRRSSPPH